MFEKERETIAERYTAYGASKQHNDHVKRLIYIGFDECAALYEKELEARVLEAKAGIYKNMYAMLSTNEDKEIKLKVLEELQAQAAKIRAGGK